MKVKFLLLAAMACVGMSSFAASTAATDTMTITSSTINSDGTVTCVVGFKNANAYSALQWFVNVQGAEFVQSYDEEIEDNQYTIIDYTGRCKKWTWADKVTNNTEIGATSKDDTNTVTGSKFGVVWYQPKNNPNCTASDTFASLFSIKMKPADGVKEIKWYTHTCHWANGQDATLDGDGPVTNGVISATGVNDINVVKANTIKKVYENGQVVIYNGDVKYNVMGAQIK